MNRREFLERSALALAALSLDPSSVLAESRPKLKRARSRQRITIVGAGLAGLSAGFELVRAGHTVTILEARVRPGGRVHTLRDAFCDGLHAEEGAARIHDEHVLVREYAREFGLELVPFYPANPNDVFVRNGERKVFPNLVESDFAGLSDRYRGLITCRLSHEHLWKIDGGSDRLPRAFARSLKANIRYGAPVVRLEQDHEKVRAVYDRAGEQRMIESDRLICTIPFSVLRNIPIVPGVSEAKHRAIVELPYVPLGRVLLQSGTRFWESRGESGFGMSPTAELWHPTFDQTGPRSVLSFYPNADMARDMSALPGDLRKEFALEHVHDFFPEIRGNVEGIVSKCWDHDRWSRGAGSRPDSLGELRSAVAVPEGRLHFAGEHTSSKPFWMEGAIESGVRAAREVNDA